MRVPQVSERIKEAPAQALRGVFAGIGQLLLITDKLRNKAPFGQQVPHPRVPEPSGTAAASRTAPAEPVPDRAPAERDVVAEPGTGQSASPPSTPRAPRAPKVPQVPAAPQASKAPVAAAEIRDFDKTGNVRLITGDEAYADDEPPAAEASAPAAEPEHEPKPAPAAAAEEVLAPTAVEPEHEPEPEPVAAAEEPARRPSDSAPPLPNYDGLSIASLRARLRNLDVTQVRGLVEYEKAHAGRADVIVMFERRIAKLEAGD